MVTENTGLIWSVARRFFGRGVEPDNLYQLGCVGFLKAMQGFDEQLRHLFFYIRRAEDLGGDPALSAR